MNRLVVNPDRPDTWEIQLKDGNNLIGRGEAADFKIADPSVSTSHCQIAVNDGAVKLNDLGSTNGTFINGEKVMEARLEDGQKLRLGGVEMMFRGDVPASAPAPAAPAFSKLRVSGISHEPEPASPSAAGDVPPPLVPAAALQSAATVCKFHPKVAASWFCPKCAKSFCELCVTSRPSGETVKKICRHCAVECAPLEVQVSAPAERGFLTSLPGALIYPFRGTGILILIFSTLLFSGLALMSGGLFSFFFTIMALGYLFSYMQNILHATANEEEQMPELPGMDDLFGGFLRLAGTVVMSFGLAIGLLVARYYEVDVPLSAILITAILGCFYFPMAFLAVAMKDNVFASNPLIVLPSIMRVILPYFVTVILFLGIFGIQRIGDIVSGGAKAVAFTTTDMSVMFLAFGIRIIWSFLSVYLLTVNMRIMGLLYLTQKEKLGWY